MTYEERLKLFQDNLGLPYHISARYKCPEESRDDMLQEGMLAMWRATDKFDPDAGFRFTTFAGRYISRAYSNFTARAWNSSGLSACGTTIRAAFRNVEDGTAKFDHRSLCSTAISTESYYHRQDDDDVTIADMLPVEDDHSEMIESDMRDVVEEALIQLSPEDRKILVMRFGLDGSDPMTLYEIADVYGITHQSVLCRIRRILRDLKKTLPESSIEFLR